jgi:hypothetical protein
MSDGIFVRCDRCRYGLVPVGTLVVVEHYQAGHLVRSERWCETCAPVVAAPEAIEAICDYGPVRVAS